MMRPGQVVSLHGTQCSAVKADGTIGNFQLVLGKGGELKAVPVEEFFKPQESLPDQVRGKDEIEDKRPVAERWKGQSDQTS